MPDQPEPFVERRKKRRREEDEVVDHAVQDAPLVRRLLQTGKVAGAMLAVGTLIGGVGAAFGQRIVGPGDDLAAIRSGLVAAEQKLNTRIDTTRADIGTVKRRQDSLMAIMTDVRTELRLSNYGQCVMMRRFAPDLLPPGCDAVGRKATGGSRP